MRPSRQVWLDPFINITSTTVFNSYEVPHHVGRPQTQASPNPDGAPIVTTGATLSDDPARSLVLGAGRERAPYCATNGDGFAATRPDHEAARHHEPQRPPVLDPVASGPQHRLTNRLGHRSLSSSDDETEASSDESPYCSTPTPPGSSWSESESYSTSDSDQTAALLSTLSPTSINLKKKRRRSQRSDATEDSTDEEMELETPSKRSKSRHKNTSTRQRNVTQRSALGRSNVVSHAPKAVRNNTEAKQGQATKPLGTRIYLSCFTPEEKEYWVTSITVDGVSFVNSVEEATHIVANGKPRIGNISVSVVAGISQGKWILHPTWLEALEEAKAVPEDTQDYELADSLPGCRAFRLAYEEHREYLRCIGRTEEEAQEQGLMRNPGYGKLPLLFSTWTFSMNDQMDWSLKPELEAIITRCGGVITDKPGWADVMLLDSLNLCPPIVKFSHEHPPSDADQQRMRDNPTLRKSQFDCMGAKSTMPTWGLNPYFIYTSIINGKLEDPDAYFNQHLIVFANGKGV